MRRVSHSIMKISTSRQTETLKTNLRLINQNIINRIPVTHSSGNQTNTVEIIRNLAKKGKVAREILNF